ncbi:MAG: NfeD family protein [Planctomycetaceae bacterium]|nr:ATP-dependent Clp protease proteolytic subunit [Planctomycetaceae bacterium]
MGKSITRRSSAVRAIRRGGLAVVLGLLVWSNLIEAQPQAATRATATAPQTGPARWPAAPADARFTAEGWFARIEPAQKRPALPAKIERAYVIEIHDEINEPMYETMRQKVLGIKAEAQLVVFDIDTPGGAVGAMQDIARLIQQDLAGVYTVAFVNPEAISAGAVIALACSEIDMVPNGKIGDSMPVMMGQQMPADLRAKIESYMKTLLDNLARQGGYDPLLVQAMMTKEIEVSLRRHKDTGQLQFVDADEWQKKVDEKLPETSQWLLLRTIDSKNHILTMTTEQAVDYGFCKNVFKDMHALATHFNVIGDPKLLKDDAGQKFIRFMNSGVVQSLLVMGMLVLGYMEFQTPGFGVAGTLAIACLVLIVLSRVLMGLANPLEIFALVVGLALIAVEIFVLPGYIIFGAAGGLIVIIALLAMIIPNAPTEFPMPKTNLDWSIFNTGLAALLIAMVGSTIAIALLARYLPRVPLVNRLVLAATHVEPAPPVEESSPLKRIAVGDVGVVERVCRPVGKVRFGDDLVDAASEGSIIAAGTRVRVIRHDGNGVVVEEA